MSEKRELKYREALAEGLTQAMEANDAVFAMGVGIADPKGIFGTTLDARLRFGEARVQDIPLSENSITGMAIGSSLTGLRPVMIHARNDFLLLTLDQLINNASKWRYVSCGTPVPLTVRAIIGRGWGQGAQHSQSLQATFAHFPGIKVVMPATPYDAKGLLIAAVMDDNPVIFLEHRQLYEVSEPVPEEYYEVPLGKAVIRRPGTDVTIVACSFMVPESLRAAEKLEGQGVSAEVIDLRTVAPLDNETIFGSVERTGRLIVADTSWRSGGIASEVVSRVAANRFAALKAAPRIVASPDIPAPVSYPLERLFYPGVDDLVAAAVEAVGGKPAMEPTDRPSGPIHEEFHGPF